MITFTERFIDPLNRDCYRTFFSSDTTWIKVMLLALILILIVPFFSEKI